MKLDKIKVICADSLLTEADMKNITAGREDGASDVDCDVSKDENSCHGVCYSHAIQGSCEMLYMPMWGYDVCSCYLVSGLPSDLL